MFKNLNIFRPIIAILILFIPLYPKFPLFNVSGTYVAIRLDDIIIALSVLIWFIYQLRHRFPVFKNKITKLFIVYFVAICISFLNAFLIYQTDPTNVLILNLFRRFEYMSLFFIALESIHSVKDLKNAYIFLFIATVFVCIYGYGQKYFNFPIISTMNSEFSKGELLQMDVWTRISSTFAGHYDLAAFLSVVLIIIAAVALISKNIFVKIISLLIWLPGYQILTLTASRVSTFAFLGGICVTLILLKKYLWIIPISGIVVFSIFNSKDLNQRLLATIPAFQTQMSSIQNEVTPTIAPTLAPTAIPTAAVPSKNITPIPTVVRHQSTEVYPAVDTDVGVARSGEIRFNVEWPRAINAFKKNIIVGTGLGSITLATDNDYLRSLGESGLFGFISFAAIFIFFIAKTIPIIFIKNKTYPQKISLIFLGCLLATLANAVFIDVFEASKTAYLFWIMMAFYYQTFNLKDEKN
jgi:hypothetical protein